MSAERPVILEVFPGASLFGRAFEEVWPEACVVRGPDRLWGGDIRAFHPPAGVFDGIIAGPPCQIFSIMKRLNPRAGEKHGNLVPEFERVVYEAQPDWFVMENVWPDSPEPAVPGYVVHRQMVRDVWVGGETRRPRAISFGTPDGRKLEIETLALHRPDPEPSVLAGGGGARAPVAIGGTGKRKKTLGGHRPGPHTGQRAPVSALAELQGLPPDFFGESPFTVEGQRHMLGQGVPMAMGRAIARAVRRALTP